MSRRSSIHSNRLQAFGTQVMTTLQTVAVGTLLLCSASVYVSPQTVKALSVFTLGFPFLLLLAIVIGLLALLFTPRRAWITLLGLVLCSGTIRNYCPVNIPRSAPDSSWHVMTWNMGGTTWDDSSRTVLHTFLEKQRLDILVVQEISSPNAGQLANCLKDQMPYSRFLGDSQWYGHSIFSRWPILTGEKLTVSGANRAILYQIQSPLEDTLFVVSCHLQSMHLDSDVRSDYSAIVHRQETNRDSVQQTSNTLLRHIMDNGALRALQADTIAQFLRAHAGRPVIVAGDFNDTPVSYTRQVIAEAAPLTDCFRASGNGIGRSFNRDAIYVRIDHLFCTENFKPYACRLEQTPISDHYPLHGYLLPLKKE